MKWELKKPKRKPNKDDSIIDRIAKIRGIEDAQRFLNPTKAELHDPYLMKNIEEASARILWALEHNEQIVVAYDPDADGITSTTIMLRYLRNYSDRVDSIYGQRNDGHGIFEMITVSGLNPETEADRIAHNKANSDKVRDADLLILIDSSSNDVEACRFITEKLNTDIIILDHHAIEKKNPHALLVNPQQADCKYPNKHLSGAGVVFKTLEVMEDTQNQVDIWQYIDLVAVGMYADMMRVDVLENRYLILEGLRNIRNPGLIRILKGAKVDMYRGIDGDAVGFSIAPLLNGVARMDNIKLAIDILLEDDDTVCKKLRLEMQKLNESRKVRQREIVNRYKKIMDNSGKVVFVMDDESSKGFNGLVAQQLSGECKKPAIVGRLHKGVLSGSFRSFSGFKFKQFLQGFDGEIEAMGHEPAGGIIIKEEELENLYTYIDRHMPELEHTEPTLTYDLEIGAEEMNEYLPYIEQFNHLAGSGFPRIMTRVNGITIEEAQCIGATQETVKIQTMDDMVLIKFRVNEQYASELAVYDLIDVVGKVTMNRFFNFKLKKLVETPQVMLEDYKLT